MTLPQSYFDDLYTGSDDPWSFQTRRYEARKRALTLSALLEERYATAFEPGCSIGVLTVELAGRCDALLATDVSAAALAQARPRVPAHVTLQQASITDWPDRPFDLVVLSEVAYYLDRADCERVCALAVAGAAEVVAVHWRHPVADYPLGGDEVHEVLATAARAAGRHRAVEHVERDLLLDVWAADDRSVAQRAGMVEGPS